MRVLVVSVGYYNLGDLSLGPLLLPQLQKLDWPEYVEFDDFSFGPIAVMQRMEDRPGYFNRVVFLAGVGRPGRTPGGVYCYRWRTASPSIPEVQQCVTEGATGVVSLDNVLIIGEYFKVWPDELIVVEVEPALEEWGDAYSEPVQAIVHSLPGLVREAALGPVQKFQENPSIATIVN